MNQGPGQMRKALFFTTFAAGLAMFPAPAFAADDQALLTRIEQMERELSDLKARLEQTEGRSVQPASGPDREQPSAEPPRYRGVTPRASPPVLSDTSIHIAGYADASLALFDRGSGAGSSFGSATFNPALYVQYRDLVLMESELEIAVNQKGETELELEFAQLDFLLHDNVTLVAGKFLSPVGQFQERLHPSWINRLTDAPPGFGHDGVQPTAEMGLQLRGGIPLGRSRVTYALAVGNGPRLDGAGGVMTEGFGGDDNGNKAISGRIGFLPVPYFEVGASLLRARVRGPAGEGGDAHVEGASLTIASEEEGGGVGLPATDVDYNLWGVDAAYTRGPWDVRFEYLRGVRDSISIPMEEGGSMELLPRLRLTAWYGQLAYRLSGLTRHPVLGNFEPVVRYGEYKINGLDELKEEAQEKRFDLGLNYWFAPSIVLHSAFQIRRFTGRHADDDRRDSRALFKLAYGF